MEEIRGQDSGFVRSAFAAIAGKYVLTNHVLSLGIDVLWRKTTANRVAALNPKFVLDLATGSGDLALEIQKKCPDAHILGADFSEPMLEEARKRGLKNLMVADAMNLPIEQATADVVTVAFGLRNMADYAKALKEMGRVLKPGGSLFVLDFSLPQSSILRAGHLFYLRHLMPRIAGMITGQKEAYQYLCSSIEKFPAGASMCQLIESQGFQNASSTPLHGGIASLYQAQRSH